MTEQRLGLLHTGLVVVSRAVEQASALPSSTLLVSRVDSERVGATTVNEIIPHYGHFVQHSVTPTGSAEDVPLSAAMRRSDLRLGLSLDSSLNNTVQSLLTGQFVQGPVLVGDNQHKAE